MKENNGVKYLRYTLNPNAPTGSGCGGCNYVSSSRPSAEIVASHELLEAITNEALGSNNNPNKTEFSDFCAGGFFQTIGFNSNLALDGSTNLPGWGRNYFFHQVPSVKPGGGYSCGPVSPDAVGALIDMTA